MKMFILSDMFIHKAAVNEDRKKSFFYIFFTKHRWYEIHVNIIQETIVFLVITQLRYSHLFQSRNANAALENQSLKQINYEKFLIRDSRKSG